MTAETNTIAPAIEHGLQQPADADSKTREDYELKEEEYIDSNNDGNLHFEQDAEPELHWRTWLAIVAMHLLVFTAVLGLQGPAAVLSFIGADLHNIPLESWIVNGLSLSQAVIGPVLCTASDTFQARKSILVGASAISFVGTTIAPGATEIYRVIGATILIGVGFAAIPLAYAVPAEVLPRKWRPFLQATINAAALLSTVLGPFTIGALTRRDPHTGWRYFYWFQTALWGAVTIFILVGYRPPKRHTKLDNLSFWQKLGRLDLVGFCLIVIGLTLFLVGAGFGGGKFTWHDRRVLAPLIIGIVGLICFGIWEWKGTSTGILHHDLFHQGRAKALTFVICTCLLTFEGLLIFSHAIFFPLLTRTLYTQDPIEIVLRGQSAWLTCFLSTIPWGYLATRLRNIRYPLMAGFTLVSIGMIGLSTWQPSQSGKSLAFSVIYGLGLGAPFALAVSGAQLVVPHHVLARASGVLSCGRAFGVAIFTAIFYAVYHSALGNHLPKKIAAAAAAAGLPAASIKALIAGYRAGSSQAVLANIPDVTPQILKATRLAYEQSQCDSVRLIFIIAAVFASLGAIFSFFICDLREAMTYTVEAPMEKLHAKRQHHSSVETHGQA